MKFFRKKAAFLALAFLVCLGLFLGLETDKPYIKVTYTVQNDHCDTFDLFFTKDGAWSELNKVSADYLDMGEKAQLTFTVPTHDVSALRFDLGNIPGDVTMENLILSVGGQKFGIDYEALLNEDSHSVDGSEVLPDGIRVASPGDDPFFVYNLTADSGIAEAAARVQYITKFAAMAAALIVLAFCYRFSSSAIEVAKCLWKNKAMILKLAKSDFKARYAGSQFGILWAFVQPTVTSLIYIFVFQVIGKAAPVATAYPYALWLLAGIISWFFFSESAMSASNSLIEYSYLVKKVLFDIDILPVVKVLSAFFVHAFLTGFVLLVYMIAGCPLQLTMLQIPYYMICNIALCIAFSFLNSAILPFFKDYGQLLNVLLMVGMWCCPIMWDLELLPDQFLFLVKMNPVYYIIQGFRDSYMGQAWVFDNLPMTIYFWLFTLAMMCVSTMVFKRLSKHFADVL